MVLRGQRVFIGLLLFCVVVVVVFGFVFLGSQNERWAAMKKRVNELQAEARSRSVPRSVLRGQSIPGNAWDEYTVAINDAQTWTEDFNGEALGNFIADRPTDRGKVDRMIAAHASALDHVRLAARRTDGQYPYQWERGSQMEIPSLAATRLLSRFALAQAKVWTESGRTQEATDLMLDTLVFARDMGSNGPLLSMLIGDSIYLLTFDQLRNLLLSGKLTAAQLEDLERKLAIVDHDFPSLVPTMANENLFLGMSAANEGVGDATLSERVQLAVRGGWRYGFSSTYMAADAFEERESYVRRAQNVDNLGNAAARREAGAIESEAAVSDNPVTRMMMPSWARSDQSHHGALARLRLLRAAAGFLRTGTMPKLEDPFGSYLLQSEKDGKVQIWSVGWDGKDGGGVGGWPVTPGQLDIVLEIER